MTLLDPQTEIAPEMPRRAAPAPLLAHGRPGCWTKTWRSLLQPPAATRYRGLDPTRATTVVPLAQTPVS